MIVIVAENNSSINECSRVFIDQINRIIGVSNGQNVVLSEYPNLRQAQYSMVMIATAIANKLPIYVMESQKYYPDSYITEDLYPSV
ncbi:MAG TPA: hypothetical protein P5123_13075 [Spirochaetota bacterium]|nr:hypothetical protein [Spirochaetota bacterium]